VGVTRPHGRRVAALSFALLVTVLVGPRLAVSPSEAAEKALGPWRVDVTQSLIVESHLDNGDGNDSNDNFQSIREKLSLGVQKGIYRFQGRFELTKFMGLPDSGRAPEPLSDIPVWIGEGAGTGSNWTEDWETFAEKLTFEVRSKGTRVYLGDFYQVLGRGLLLSLRKMDELGLDTTLRGAKAHFRDRRVSVTAFGGYANVVNIDTVSWQRIDDPNDLISGADAYVTLPVGLRLGLQGLALRARSDSEAHDGAPEDVWAVGGVAEWKRLGLYAELDYMRRSRPKLNFLDVGEFSYRGRDDRSGMAAFVSAVRPIGPVTLLIEGKWTDAFALRATPRPGDDLRGIAPIPYNAAPTLEKEDLRITPHDTVLGTRGRVSVNLGRLDAVIFLNYSHFFEPLSLGDNEVPRYDDIERIDHVYATWEQTLLQNRATLNLTGGYREEIKKDPEPDHRLWYVESEASLPVATGTSVDLLARHEGYSDDEPGALPDEAYGEGTLAMTWTFFHDFLAAFAFDYSTQKSSERTWFPSGSLEWKYAGASSLKTFVGMTRGGLRCVGGVCKLLPPVNGAWVQWVHRF
jgi:hypothetical protein